MTRTRSTGTGAARRSDRAPTGRWCLALLTAVGLVGAGGATAAPVQNWRVEAEASRLGFVGTQGGARFEGRFARFDADVRLDPARLAESRVGVTIEMASATTGDATRDQALVGSAWFDVAVHPTARFASTGFRALAAGRFEADAILTIRDRSRPVTLPFALAIDGDRASVVGALTLVRTDYGVGQGPWATGDVVGREVEVTIALALIRVGGVP